MFCVSFELPIDEKGRIRGRERASCCRIVFSRLDKAVVRWHFESTISEMATLPGKLAPWNACYEHAPTLHTCKSAGEVLAA